MRGKCQNCHTGETKVKKVDGGSAGVVWLCQGCYNDMVSGPFRV